MRLRSIAVLALALLPALPTHAGGPPDDAARRAKVEAAKKVLAEDEAAFQTKVNAAIDRGVAWLRDHQKSSGNFPAFGDTLAPGSYNPMDLGVNGLVLLTLAKCGVPSDDKMIERLKTWAFGGYANMKGLKKVTVYSAATLLLGLDAAYNQAPKDDTTVTRDRYGSTVAHKHAPCKWPAPVQALIEELVKVLRADQLPKLGGWRYPGNTQGSPPGDADLSNTQYAMLALNAAARCGVSIPAEVWLRAAEWVLAAQEKDGAPGELWVENAAWEPGLDDVARFQSAGKRKARGWTYMPASKDGSTGSMTTAGIACLAIAKERLMEAGKLTPELTRRLDAAMLDGLVWLSEAFTITDNPVMPSGGAPWHYYYLYGLERVMSLTGVAFFGKNAAYRLGAEHLLGAQEKDGRWREASAAGRTSDESESMVTQTCFALLFLRRATTPPQVPVTPQGLTGGDAPPTDGRDVPPPK